jgi:hypothetical protein
MEIKHIKDCWTLIRHEKTIEGVKKVLEELPRWSGDWYIEIEDNQYVVYNNWYDEQLDEENVDYEILDIEVEEDEADRSELPWDYSKHFE